MCFFRLLARIQQRPDQIFEGFAFGHLGTAALADRPKQAIDSTTVGRRDLLGEAMFGAGINNQRFASRMVALGNQSMSRLARQA